MELQELLERDVPLRIDVVADWDDVVMRARPPRRRRLPLAAAAVAAAAGLAFAVVALWPGGGGSVLQRALAAVGDGPIVHVVLRSDVHPALVDLRTGAERPLWLEEEEWYEPGVGLRRVDRFDGQVIATSVVGPQHVTAQQQQAYGDVLDGYRDALANGDARIAGSDEVAGHDVYWVAFTPSQLPDVGDGRNHAFAVEVAVDRTTYRPVYLRFTRDGVPSPDTGTRILSLDTVAAGSVDLTPAPSAPGDMQVLSVRDAQDVTADAASVAPLWPGATLRGLSLTYARSVSFEHGDVHAPQRTPGVVLCYGPTLAGPGAICDPHRGILLQEAPDPVALELASHVDVPDGSVLLGWGPGALLHAGDVYVRITADDPRAVAQALYEAKTSR